MRNLIVALTVLFTLGLTAQTKTSVSTTEIKTTRLTPEMAAENNVVAVNNFVPIDSKTQASLQTILTSKYEILYSNKELSNERKSALSQSISSQIENVVGKEKFTKIKSDTILYESLIN